MKIWQRLPEISAPMPFQMALDEILFRKMEKNQAPSPYPLPRGGEGERSSGEGAMSPILRFYFSSKPWITTGYFENPAESLNGISACRRLTGGGRVLHGQDLIFSIIAAKKDDDSFVSVRASYRKIHEAVKQSLEALGQKPSFYSPSPRPLPQRGEGKRSLGEGCFLNPIESDLEFNGKKIAGGAQKRSRGILLHQESVQLRAGMDADRLIPALCRAFESHFQIKLEEANLNLEDWSLALKLAKEKYESNTISVIASTGADAPIPQSSAKESAVIARSEHSKRRSNLELKPGIASQKALAMTAEGSNERA